MKDDRKDDARRESDRVNAGLIHLVAQHGDRQAFSQLFDRLAPQIKSFMMRSGADPQLAEDLVQEAMIAVWTKAGLFDPARGSASSWVFTIARNLKIDRLRRESSAVMTSIDGFDSPSGDPGSDDILAERQAQGIISRALLDIPEEQRAILTMSFIEDIPQSEIAGRLSLPLGTVKSRMRLAYGRLRKSLEQLK